MSTPPTPADAVLPDGPPRLGAKQALRAVMVGAYGGAGAAATFLTALTAVTIAVVFGVTEAAAANLTSYVALVMATSLLAVSVFGDRLGVKWVAGTASVTSVALLHASADREEDIHLLIELGATPSSWAPRRPVHRHRVAPAGLLRAKAPARWAGSACSALTLMTAGCPRPPDRDWPGRPRQHLQAAPTEAVLRSSLPGSEGR